MLRGYDILDTPPEKAFDDIVEAASVFCDVPITLVSLVDEDRQWFKACLGLNVSQTPLDQAVCRREQRSEGSASIARLAQLSGHKAGSGGYFDACSVRRLHHSLVITVAGHTRRRDAVTEPTRIVHELVHGRPATE